MKDIKCRRALVSVCIFILILIVFFLVFLGSFDNRIRSLETTAPSIDVEQSLFSQGWVEECSQSVNVSKYRFVDEYKDYGCDSDLFVLVCASSSPDSQCRSYCSDGRRIDVNNYTVVPAHVMYYNESVCTKYILVKKGGLNG